MERGLQIPTIRRNWSCWIGNWQLKRCTPFNSVALLAQHLHYYVCGIINVFEEGNLEIRDQFSFDFPILKSNDEWQLFLAEFWKDTESLKDLVLKVPDTKWAESFVDEKYGSYLRNLDGLIEHAYYHLGQIVLIKKMLELDEIKK